MRRLSKPMRVAVLFTVAVLLFAQNFFVLDAKAESIAVYSCDFEDGKDGWQTYYGGTTTVSADQSVSGTHSLKMTNRSQPWHSPGKNIYSIVKKCGTGKYYVNMCVYVTKVKEDFPHMGFLLRTTKENSFSKSDAVGNYFCRLQDVYNISANRWITVYGSFTVTEEDISASSGEFNLMIDVLEPVDGQEVYIDSVNLIKDVDNSSFTMTSSYEYIYEGEVSQLVTDPNFGVQFYSDNESIAKVNSYGLITGISQGETTVYAVRGSKRLSCRVVVDIASTIETGTYLFRNTQYGTYLQVDSADSGNNYSSDQAKMKLYDYDGGNYQQWTIFYLGGGYYQILSANSRKALSVQANEENSDNCDLVQETYSGSDRQKWQIIPIGDGNYKLKPKSSTSYTKDWCAAANGSKVQQRQFVSSGSNRYIGEWTLFDLAKPIIYLDVLYDNGYAQRYSAYASRIDNHITELQEKYLQEFGVWVQDRRLLNKVSKADECNGNNDPFFASRPYEAVCTDGTNDECSNSNNSKHHKNIYNMLLSEPLPDSKSVRMLFTGHTTCSIAIDGTHRMAAMYGLTETVSRRMVISNHDSKTSEEKTVIHEFGHIFGAPDHYGYGCQSTDSMNEQSTDGVFSSDCIYGENKDEKSVLSNMTICAGCKAAIRKGLNKQIPTNG